MSYSLKGLWFIRFNDNYISHGQFFVDMGNGLYLIKIFHKDTGELIEGDYAELVSIDEIEACEWRIYFSAENTKAAYKRMFEEDDKNGNGSTLKVVPIRPKKEESQEKE